MKGADEERLAAGMDAYLTKPIDRSQLDAVLTRFLFEGAAVEAGTPELADQA